MVTYTGSGAVISPDQRYRYWLYREWFSKDGEPEPVVFIMLNPSTADADKDDPTIRKCVGFARRWSYEKIIIVNLFAYRATKPAELRRIKGDIEGPGNWVNVSSAIAKPCLVVCAWGNNIPSGFQDMRMVDYLRQRGVKPKCLGTTKMGYPRHPLMVSYDTSLKDFNPL